MYIFYTKLQFFVSSKVSDYLNEKSKVSIKELY